MSNLKSIFLFEIKKVSLRLRVTLVLCILFTLISIILKPSYIQSEELVFQNQNLYNDVFLYTGMIIPLLSSILIFNIFKEDYDSKLYEIISIYNNNKINYILLIKFLIVIISMIGFNIICTILLMSKTNFIKSDLFLLDLSFFSILIKNIPTILWYSVLPLFLLVIIRSSKVSIIILITYISIDIIGPLYLYPFVCTWNYNINTLIRRFDIYHNLNNQVTIITNWELMNKMFLMNRFIFLSLSLICIFIIMKRSITLQKSKT